MTRYRNRRCAAALIPSPRYLPCAGFLLNFKLTVFLIFPVLLCWRLGSWGGGAVKKNQYGVAGDLGACELQGAGAGRAACSAALSRGTMGVSFRDQGQVTGRGQEQRRGGGGLARYLLSNARNWEISSTRHQGSLISSLRSLRPTPSPSPPPSCGVTASTAPSYLTTLLTTPPPSPAVIYGASGCDNAHATNLSAEHIDSRVCHYPFITPLTHLSIRPSWQPTRRP